MAEARIVDMHAALTSREFPTITLWNRLEGRPRRDDFDRAMRAEVRDALWMLSRQWQVGEFLGDDAGSPIFAKLAMWTSRLTKYQPRDHAPRPFSEEVPLEAEVETQPIPFEQDGHSLSLDLRLLLGRRWLKLLAAEVGDFSAELITGYPIAEPDPEDPGDAHIAAHAEVWQRVTAFAGRAMDGYALYRYLKEDPTHHAHDGTSIPAADHAAVEALEIRFVEWVERFFHQPPPDGDAWDPSRLEYRFSCAAPGMEGEKVYVADEYYHGRLDWYNVEVDPERASLDIPDDPPLPDPRAESAASFVPVQVAFDGMPSTRWWAFEDRKTSFGDVTPATTDLAKLLYVEFGLIYANDWFLIPHALPAGSLARVRGLAVTNVFGERIWVEPAGSGADDDWQRWTMFTISTRGRNALPADRDLLLLPTVPKIQEGPPVDEVYLIRDEMANMVWGIESRIPVATGEGRNGRESAFETLSFHRRVGGAAPAAVPEPAAPIRYRVMSSVPENWIPFIPVHVPGSNREIQLQRAGMPRIVEGAETLARVRPRTTLLREGLDRTPREPYFLHEEEVPRAGVRVTRSYQRTRWYGGKVVNWLGVRKQVGRGSGASNLAFDSLVDVPFEQE